jgi:ABC-type transport system involved in multi-copper enzyme maturation permease subunit
MNQATQPGLSPAPSQAPRRSSRIWSELIVENPLLGQAARDQLRFFRNPQLGRYGPTIVIVIVVLFYAWMVVAATLSDTDGTVLFSYIEITLLTLVLTGSIYGAVSGEREKATWDALILTRLTPAQIIVGKLVWRLRLTLFIAVLAIIPIVLSRYLAVTFDVTAEDAAVGQLVVLCWSIFVACFGLFVSSITKRSITSLAAIAVSLICAVALIPGVYMMLASATNTDWNDKSNPDVLFNTVISFNPALLYYILDRHQPDYSAESLPAGAIATGWPQILVYLLLAAGCVYLTYRRLRQLEEPDRGRDKKRRKPENHASTR